jgi:glycosyltransferase involved in cell wall biosynthesis
VHVFFIPSWYPTTEQPVSGCFFREQALALGCLGGDIRVSVSLHGAGAYALRLRNPLSSARRFKRFIRASPRRVETPVPNVVEIERPTLEWSPALAGGNLRGMLNSHYANFVEAEGAYGSVDLIHAHIGFPAGWIARKLSHRFRRPFVISEQMTPFPFSSREFLNRDGTLTDRLKFAYGDSARNIASSPTLANEMTRYGIPRIAIIPNLVNEERFFPTPRVRTGDEFVFFSLCNLVAQKGVDDLLKATARAMAEIPSLRLIIGGDGPLRDLLKTLASNLHISGRIKWLGPVNPELAQHHYQNCDAFILASRAEMFGMVYAEALASAKPVIATRCGGPESIIHDGNGFLVETGDVAAIAAAMVKMARYPDRFRPEEIRRDFLERFSRAAVVQQLTDLYRNVLSERKQIASEVA